MMRNFAVNVRALRQAQGWSMQELGQRTGIGWRAIENWENELNAPSFIAVFWLAEAFDVTVNQLVYYPLEAFDGRLKSTKNGKFIVPSAPVRRAHPADCSCRVCKPHPPRCECAECWEIMEAGP